MAHTDEGGICSRRIPNLATKTATGHFYHFILPTIGSIKAASQRNCSRLPAGRSELWQSYSTNYAPYTVTCRWSTIDRQRRHVAFWHKCDVPTATSNVRFQG